MCIVKDIGRIKKVLNLEETIKLIFSIVSEWDNGYRDGTYYDYEEYVEQYLNNKLRKYTIIKLEEDI